MNSVNIEKLLIAAQPAATALQALQSSHAPETSNNLRRQDHDSLVAHAYRKCRDLADHLGCPTTTTHNPDPAPPTWFHLAARNIRYGITNPEAAILLAATIAATPPENPPGGTLYSTDGSAAITWNQDQLKLHIKIKPDRLPTFDLQQAGQPRRRGLVHLEAPSIRRALSAAARQLQGSQTIAHPPP